MTFEQFKNSNVVGSACACMGPQDGDPYCPCSMNFLNMLIEEDRPKLMEMWREKGYLPHKEMIAKQLEPPMSEFRRKRLELIKQKQGK